MNEEKNKHSLLNNFDFYGIDFPLRYKNQERYSSLIGIILSLISIILILIILIFQAKNIFNYKYYTLFLDESYNNDYYINLNELNIMIGIVDNKGNFIEIDDNYLTISAKINNFSIQSNNELNLNSSFLDLISCNLTNIKINEEFNNSNLLCFNPNQSLNIKGKYNDFLNGFSDISVYINKCNKSYSKKCKSNVGFDKYIQNKSIVIMYLSDNINNEKINTPIFKKYISESFSITNSILKRINLIFSPSIYYLDSNLIFNEYKKFNFYENKYIEIDFIDNNNENNIIEILFTTNSKLTKYYKNYNKFSNALGIIGGYINIIFIVFQRITCYFAKKSLIIDITKTLVCDKCKQTCELLCNRKMNQSLSNNISNFNLMEQINNNRLIFKNQNSYYNNNNESQKNISKPQENSKINMLRPEEISNNQLKEFFQNKEKREKQRYQFSWIDYFIPQSFIKRFRQYSLLYIYTEIFYSYLSIEQIIPVIERFSKLCSDASSLGILLKAITGVDKNFSVFNKANDLTNVNSTQMNSEIEKIVIHRRDFKT